MEFYRRIVDFHLPMLMSWVVSSLETSAASQDVSPNTKESSESERDANDNSLEPNELSFDLSRLLALGDDVKILGVTCLAGVLKLVLFLFRYRIKNQILRMDGYY